MDALFSLPALIAEISKKRQVLPAEEYLLRRAYEFSEKAHAGQKRKTGEPYFVHVFETAMTLASWGMDSSAIAAGLLHDTIEDTGATTEILSQKFSPEIAFLVNGVTKLGKLKYRSKTSVFEESGEEEIEEARVKRMADNLRKMILAISEDLRVVFIKLADRLHNMRTLHGVSPQKRKRIALETVDIYASLAYRLGMQNLAGELEDLAFPHLHPDEYKWMMTNVKDRYDARVEYLKKVKPIVEEELKKHSITPAVLDYRAKRVSSLYKKLFRHDMNLEQVYDLVAFRIVLKTVEECYAALGVIHNLWPPLPGRIKDYIALPKPNGYRSLHTTVFCLENKVTEFQIRTIQMHEEAENGIAAHWAYTQEKTSEDFRTGKAIFADRQELTWVQQLRNWQNEFSEPQEFLRSLKIDFFQDRVFAITPKGEVIDLPLGATPVDFAYSIHTKIGDQCIGAKANGKIVPLDYNIQPGDAIEILVQKSKRPSESWLSFVKTGIAKRRIKSALKSTSSLLNTKRPSYSEIKIIASDRVGLLKDISALIARSHINIISVTVPKTNFLPTIKVICDTADKSKIEKLVLKLKTIEGVKEIHFRIV